ncbi:hypothetical protein GOP47_0021984 [Adiantum capillus-veneris]|uniref:Uncharacterized protein n=1 Tax=Adiantum capillus-veneris TaxID=13818 RepID=A0A9D4U8V5_ADICA|nr:hypothetical protein GOP47_0021984 [Adiantum capillus-veneris]
MQVAKSLLGELLEVDEEGVDVVGGDDEHERGDGVFDPGIAGGGLEDGIRVFAIDASVEGDGGVGGFEGGNGGGRQTGLPSGLEEAVGGEQQNEEEVEGRAGGGGHPTELRRRRRCTP